MAHRGELALAGRTPTIGVLWHAGSPNEEQPYFDALIQGFKEGLVSCGVTFRTFQWTRTSAWFRRAKEDLAMNTIHSPYQFQTLLGTGYVQEHHLDHDHPSLLAQDMDRRALHFAAVLEALRSALGIRRQGH
jgi:hypothetical protein